MRNAILIPVSSLCWHPVMNHQLFAFDSFGYMFHLQSHKSRFAVYAPALLLLCSAPRTLGNHIPCTWEVDTSKDGGWKILHLHW